MRSVIGSQHRLHAHLAHRRFEGAGADVWHSLLARGLIANIALRHQRQAITGLPMGNTRYARQKTNWLERAAARLASR